MGILFAEKHTSGEQTLRRAIASGTGLSDLSIKHRPSERRMKVK
jgi:hypothetical protein